MKPNFYFSISMFIRHKQKIVPIEENYFKENKKWREWNFQIQYHDLVIRWEISLRVVSPVHYFVSNIRDKFRLRNQTKPNFDPEISTHNLDAWSMHADLLLVNSNIPWRHSLGISRNILSYKMFSEENLIRYLIQINFSRYIIFKLICGFLL